MATRSHQSPFSPSRSFAGAYCIARTQITPASGNSPSGDRFADGIIADSDDKENEKDRHRSSMRKAKNFMSPTISAASKFTPSPRKKEEVVLSERNDPIPSSPYAKKSAFLDSAESSRNRPAARETKNGRKLETVLLFSSDSISTAKDQEEEALPPYDPKTNILSPRPRFLRYKPNPRTDLLLNREKGLDDLDCFKQLEDNFMAEILSDNNNFSDSVSVASSPRYSENSGVETPDDDEEEEEAEEEQPRVSSESRRIPDFEKNEKRSSSWWCFSRSVCCFVMLLTSMTAFTIQPRDLTTTLSDFQELQKIGGGEVEKQQQQYKNTSSEQENNIWDQKQYFINDGIDEKLADADILEKGGIPEEEFYEEVISDPVSSSPPPLEETHSATDDTTSVSEHGGEPEVEFDETASIPESDNWLVAATQEEEESTTAHDSEIEKLIAARSATDDTSLSEQHGGEPEVEFETASIPESDDNNRLVAVTREEESTTAAHDPDTDDEPHTNNHHHHHAMKAAYSFLAAAAAATASSMAVAFSIYQYKRRISCSAAPAETDKKNAAAIGDNNTTTTTCKEKKKLQTKGGDQTTTSSDSKPTRSFLKTASYLNKDTEEEGSAAIQSSKRRESLASSTGGTTTTPSYGSFTTFEKIPIKNVSIKLFNKLQ
ncbi:hypothetical protein M569_04859 [Genlisea aurea]|uniref:Uncharacterized protein n=1 Tax=Genlisea aurea TaxID=192259 RepID=S8E2N3_9LAMI|nr:hypothetical protein M569_04859 [Genlisea aurea]